MNDTLLSLLKKETGAVEMKTEDVSYLDNELLDNQGRFIIKPASFYKNIPQIHLRQWGHENAIYCFATTELIDWLQPHVVDKTIQIGAGNDSIGRALDIPATDSRMQDMSDVKLYCAIGKQPTVNYPDYVLKMDANSAVNIFKPDVVIGAWVTHKWDKFFEWRKGNMYGIDEKDIIKKVKKYIVIGNEFVHRKKPILNRVSKILKFPWLYSRAIKPEMNCIYIWEQN